MNFESQLEEDKRIAFEKSYTFSVEVQEGKGLPWNEQENKIEDLKDAFILASHIDGWKICITLHRDGLGFQYWESRHPGTLNSTLLTMKMEGNEPGGAGNA